MRTYERFAKKFIVANLNVFDWKHADMVRIDSKVPCHALKHNLKIKPKMQRHQSKHAEKYEALKIRWISC